MTNVSKYEDLIVWQESMDLCKTVYDLMKQTKDFGLRDQIQRSSVSIPSNIAEGFERESNKEFIRFLYIAKGSCGELRTQLIIFKSVKELNEKCIDNLIEKTRLISAMLQKLINVRKSF